MPQGLKVDKTTGAITGKPKKAGSYKFTVQATDVNGYTAKREFTMNVIESTIVSVETLNPIEVKMVKKPTLPKTVHVTYKDYTTGEAEVTWQDVDTSMVGTVMARGSLLVRGLRKDFTIKVPIRVRRNEQVKWQLDAVRAAHENWKNGIVVAKISSLSKEWKVHRDHTLGSSMAVTWDSQETALKIVNLANDDPGMATGIVVLTASDDANGKDYRVEIPIVME